jgi:hypothetical protein
LKALILIRPKHAFPAQPRTVLHQDNLKLERQWPTRIYNLAATLLHLTSALDSIIQPCRDPAPLLAAADRADLDIAVASQWRRTNAARRLVGAASSVAGSTVSVRLGLGVRAGPLAAPESSSTDDRLRLSLTWTESDGVKPGLPGAERCPSRSRRVLPPAQRLLFRDSTFES